MKIQYTKSEGVSIGYSVSGEGKKSILYVPGAYSNLALERYIPETLEWLKFLCSFGRAITFDKRATGVSDRSARPLNLDQQIVDVEAVRVATNSEKLIVCGLSQGAPLAILYSLAYPERVTALILIEGVCCDAKDPYATLTDSNTLFDWDRSLAAIDSDFSKWCLDFARQMYPDATPEDLNLEVEYMQATASPASYRFIWCCLMGFDLRPMLRHVSHPTIVIHGKEDQLYSVKHGRYLAEKIPGAQYVELESNNHAIMYDPAVLQQLKESIEKFIKDLPPEHESEPSVGTISTEMFANIEGSDFVEQATIVFTDIVSSTEFVTQVGDAAARDLFLKHDKIIRDQLKQYDGRELQNLGDGFMLSFASATVAIKCACKIKQQILEALPSIHIRIGINTGEVLKREAKHPFGQAVIVASRIVSECKGGQLLVSDVTKQLAAGSRFSFIEKGSFQPKGFKDTIKLFEVVCSD